MRASKDETPKFSVGNCDLFISCWFWRIHLASTIMTWSIGPKGRKCDLVAIRSTLQFHAGSPIKKGLDWSWINFLVAQQMGVFFCDLLFRSMLFTPHGCCSHGSWQAGKRPLWWWYSTPCHVFGVIPPFFVGWCFTPISFDSCCGMTMFEKSWFDVWCSALGDCSKFWCFEFGNTKYSKMQYASSMLVTASWWAVSCASNLRPWPNWPISSHQIPCEFPPAVLWGVVSSTPWRFVRRGTEATNRHHVISECEKLFDSQTNYQHLSTFINSFTHSKSSRSLPGFSAAFLRPGPISNLLRGGIFMSSSQDFGWLNHVELP